MPSQHGNGGPWGKAATPSSDLEVLIRQGKDRLKQMLPGGGPSGLIVLAVLMLAGLGAWTAYYTVPSDSVAVVQRFGKYLKVIPLAEGEKDQRIREADGYRLKRINEAEGDVARFSALLAQYRKAPEVTRRRIYIETLQDVLPGIRSKIIIDEQTRSILPLLNLDAQKGNRP